MILDAKNDLDKHQSSCVQNIQYLPVLQDVSPTVSSKKSWRKYLVSELELCDFEHQESLKSTAKKLCAKARWISQTDQLNGSARQISWTDQFSIFEALVSLYIRRLTFQFVHCRSF